MVPPHAASGSPGWAPMTRIFLGEGPEAGAFAALVGRAARRVVAAVVVSSWRRVGMKTFLPRRHEVTKKKDSPQGGGGRGERRGKTLSTRRHEDAKTTQRR